MRRVMIAVVGTVAGLIALLSFKTHSPITSTTLPSAGSTPDSTAVRPSNASTAPSKATPSTGGSTPKSYTGAAVDTRYGTVQVKITVTGGKISNVSFVQLTAYDQRSQEINQQAAPTLLQQTLSVQSAKIDGVSGATYTSTGYEQSLQSALDQAGI